MSKIKLNAITRCSTESKGRLTLGWPAEKERKGLWKSEYNRISGGLLSTVFGLFLLICYNKRQIDFNVNNKARKEMTYAGLV